MKTGMLIITVFFFGAEALGSQTCRWEGNSKVCFDSYEYDGNTYYRYNVEDGPALADGRTSGIVSSETYQNNWYGKPQVKNQTGHMGGMVDDKVSEVRGDTIQHRPKQETDNGFRTVDDILREAGTNNVVKALQPKVVKAADPYKSTAHKRRQARHGKKRADERLARQLAAQKAALEKRRKAAANQFPGEDEIAKAAQKAALEKRRKEAANQFPGEDEIAKAAQKAALEKRRKAAANQFPGEDEIAKAAQKAALEKRRKEAANQFPGEDEIAKAAQKAALEKRRKEAANQFPGEDEIAKAAQKAALEKRRKEAANQFPGEDEIAKAAQKAALEKRRKEAANQFPGEDEIAKAAQKAALEKRRKEAANQFPGEDEIAKAAQKAARKKVEDPKVTAEKRRRARHGLRGAEAEEARKQAAARKKVEDPKVTAEKRRRARHGLRGAEAAKRSKESVSQFPGEDEIAKEAVNREKVVTQDVDCKSFKGDYAAAMEQIQSNDKKKVGSMVLAALKASDNKSLLEPAEYRSIRVRAWCQDKNSRNRNVLSGSEKMAWFYTRVLTTNVKGLSAEQVKELQPTKKQIEVYDKKVIGCAVSILSENFIKDAKNAVETQAKTVNGALKAHRRPSKLLVNMDNILQPDENVRHATKTMCETDAAFVQAGKDMGLSLEGKQLVNVTPQGGGVQVGEM